LAIAGIGLLARTAIGGGKSANGLALITIGSLVIATWFLFVFAQTTNVNSGGTIHISRYVLWLLPLTLPFVAVTTQFVELRAPHFMLVAGLALFALYLGYFRPDQPERYVAHSPQATWLLANAPEYYQPLPEVFVERTLHIDGGPRLSAADAGCAVVFLLVAHPEQPCSLSDAERESTEVRFAAGDEAVWIRRDAQDRSVVVTALPEQ
jgi:hypothetical protein